MSFGLGSHLLATGDFKGKVSIFDLEKQETSFSVQGHSAIINSLDAFGGSATDFGASELVTGSRDGYYILIKAV